MVGRRLLWALAAVSIALAMFAARPLHTPGPAARDFEAYWAAGSAWNAHVDPYGTGVWTAERRVPGVEAKRNELLPFVGPPATLLVWSVFARWPYAVAARIWWIVLALALLALAATVLYGSAGAFESSTFFTALALGVAFAPISSDLALGQLALPAFFAAALAVVAADRTAVAGTVGACVAFAQPNASLGLISQLGRNRVTLALAFGAIATYALGALAYGADWPRRYAPVLLAHGAAERWSAIQFSVASIAYGFGVSESRAQIVALGALVVVVGAATLAAVRIRDSFARFAAFSALLPFVTTFFHEHDLLVAYAAAIWCALRTRSTTRAIALGGTLLVAIDWLGLAQRPTGMTQALLLATATWAAFHALGIDVELRSTVAAGAAIAVLFTGAIVLAAHNVMPIWPDSLAHFYVASTAPAAATWLAEQRASGLLAVVPAWSLLRCLSLLGCALLAYAIYRHSTCCQTA